MNIPLNMGGHARYGMLGLGAFFVLALAGYLTIVNYAFPNTAPLLSQVKLLHVLEIVGLAIVAFWFFRASRKTSAERPNAISDNIEGRGAGAAVQGSETQTSPPHRHESLTQNADLYEAEDRFALVLRTFDIATFYCDTDHRYTWSHNFIGDPAGLVGKTDRDILPEETADILTSLKVKALADGGMHSGELHVDIGHEIRTYSVQVAPRRNAMGHIVGTLAVSCDITEKTVWQNHLLMMMREVNHRARNMLSIIGSVCRLTEKNATNVREYRDKVSGRVMSLAATMDIVSKDNWLASSLRKIIASQLTIVRHDKARRINVRGDDVLIQSKAGQNIGLALHELISNAAEHGALKDDQGKVDLVIETRGSQDGSALTLTWQETLSKPRGEKNENGFGLQALEMILAAELDGTCEIAWQETGMVCTLNLPPSVLGVDHAFASSDDVGDNEKQMNVMVESLSGVRIALDTT